MVYRRLKRSSHNGPETCDGKHPITISTPSVQSLSNARVSVKSNPRACIKTHLEQQKAMNIFRHTHEQQDAQFHSSNFQGCVTNIVDEHANRDDSHKCYRINPTPPPTFDDRP